MFHYFFLHQETIHRKEKKRQSLDSTEMRSCRWDPKEGKEKYLSSFERVFFCFI
jgi:hypothetical protein